jgi:hypothetical protein
LYSIIVVAGTTTTTTSLVRFTTSTRTWDTVGSYGNLVFDQANPGFGALYTDRDGFIYGSESTSGRNWKFNTQLPLNSTLISRGPTFDRTVADGARCCTNNATIPNPLSCSRLGYLVQRATLYTVDLQTSQTLAYRTLGDGGTSVNGIGYNPIDFYIYGFTAASLLVRVSDTGSLTRISSNANGFGYWLIGDIDINGNLWSANPANINTGTMLWQQINLNPAIRATYGQIIGNGTSTGCNYRFADWAYVPGGGRYLYAVGIPADRVTPYVVRWGMDSHNCETLGQVQNLILPQQTEWGAFYASNDGFLYGSDNTGGRIYKFNIRSPYNATLMATGPANSENDGARCILNTEPIAA